MAHCSNLEILKAQVKWKEIDTIDGQLGVSLLINTMPSGTAAFLARQKKGRLVIPRHIDMTTPQAVFVLQQGQIALPINRLHEQIRGHFQEHLQRYHIEMRLL